MNSNGKHNGGGHETSDNEAEEGNVVRLPSLAERDRLRREEEKRNRPPREPMVNLPPATKFMAASFLFIHAFMRIALTPPQQYWIYSHFGFVPGFYTGQEPFTATAIIAPLTYMFLHGNWTHVIMNSVMMAAFGAGAERWMGARRMIVFFVLCSLSAAFIHFALNPFSSDPVIGASGGLSGLFAAIIVMMQRMGAGSGSRYGIWPFIILWIVVSVMFGMMGAPGGSAVAWAAHIGGFLAGFVFLKPVMKYIR
ncbi:MAG: rhomboid family intramembrane serine protease [Proteobacteria bacterium]|nr:rhomboid family intramembrane serine protease [Pseudomonadota bacterium]